MIFNNSFYSLFNMVIINVVIDYKRNIIMMEEKLFHLSLSMRFFSTSYTISSSLKKCKPIEPVSFFCYIVSLKQNISTSLLNSVITNYRSLYIRYQVTIKILLLKYKPALRLLSFNKCEEINHSLIE